ncbi:MAG: hypothetical protein AB7U98_03570 [Candidatus Nitrosocosmicus sp.]
MIKLVSKFIVAIYGCYQNYARSKRKSMTTTTTTLIPSLSADRKDENEILM